MKITIDPHVHTEYSSDGSVPIEKVISISRKKGLSGVAITDHNNIEGGLKLKEIAPKEFIVIVGEEIKTSEGEMIGLFLKERIPPGLSPEATIEKIKMQEGLVSIPHPFCRFRRNKIKISVLKRILDLIDIIEIFNSRNIINADNIKAFEFAKDNGKLMIMGSDAHLCEEYGNSHIKIFPFTNPKEFRNNLSSAEYLSRKTPLWVHLITKWNKWSNSNKVRKEKY